MAAPFIFLSYASEDKAAVERIYRMLKEAKLNPWMDAPPDGFRNEGIPLAVKWEQYILEKLPEAAYTLAFLSNKSLSKTSFVRQEFLACLGIAEMREANQGWLIPVLLDDCKTPEDVGNRQRFDRFQSYSLLEQEATQLIEYLKTVLPTGEKITGEHLALLQSCWRERKYDARFPNHDVHRFDVIVSAPPPVLDRIESVTYLLPPAWPTSPVTVADRELIFGLKELAWADVLVRARVRIKDQDEPIFLSTHVRLTEHGRHLVPQKT